MSEGSTPERSTTRAHTGGGVHDTVGDPPPWLIGVLVAVAFGLWRLPVLHQPPVWDGAMGVTPAAITLEQLDFDVLALLRMPDYRAGGPNVHALSLFTWVVAGIVRIFGEYVTALPFLHVLSFALMGVLGAGVYRLIRRLSGSSRLAALATVAVLMFPPLVVQGSDVYLDLPLAAAATWSLVFCFEGRWWSAIVTAAVAAAIKPTAMVLVPVLAVYALLTSGGWRRVATAALPGVVAVLPLVVRGRSRQPGVPRVQWTLRDVTLDTLENLGQMPVFLGVVAALALVCLAGMRTGRIDRQARPVLIGAFVLLVSYLGFFCLSPLASSGVHGLPRYTTLIAPMVCCALVVGARGIWGSRGGYLSAGGLLAVFLLNLYGWLEPRSGSIYPLAERSLAYEDLLSAQERALSRFEDLAETMPSYYDHFTHYRFTYPVGWTSVSPVDGTPVWIRPGEPWGALEGMPNRFVMMIEAPWLGGRELALIYQNAVDSPDWTVEAETFREGDFANHVIVVTRAAQ